MDTSARIENLETDRLEALRSYNILDTPAEEEFDALARLASQICGTHFSQINLIDAHRLWMKSGIPRNIGELPRDQNFCNHTIRQDEWMIVNDASKDDRFNDLRFVKDDPRIRFYAGVNLKSSNGYNIGTICVLDHEPRDLDKRQLESLKILAHEVEARLELRRKQAELETKNRELEQQTTFLRGSTDLIFMIDPEEYIITEINCKVIDFLEYEAGELTGRSVDVILPGESEHLKQELEEWQQNSDDVYVGEYRFQSKHGRAVWLRIHLTEKGGRLYATARDVTKQKTALNQLQKKEEELFEAFQNLKHAQHMARMGNWELDLSDGTLTCSDEVYEIYEIERGSYKPSVEAFIERTHPDDREKVRNLMTRISRRSYGEFEHRILTDENGIKYVMEQGEVTYDENGQPVKVTGTIQDITRRRLQEKKIEQSLREKEVLLAEIHHRVKNNLAIIAGLLQMEALNTENKHTQNILQNNHLRIQSMAFVHELLYQAGDFTNVSFEPFIENIIQTIESAYRSEAKEIRIDTRIDKIMLNVNQAIPLALIINEMTTNACKHAFNGRDSGTVGIELLEKNERIYLTISDDGIGLPDDFRLETRESLGFTLVNILSGQLEAEVEIEEDGGTCFRITFQKNDKKGSSSSMTAAAEVSP